MIQWIIFPTNAANPVTAGTDALTPQLPRHLTAAVERILHEQLVDAAHQRQLLRALALFGAYRTTTG